MDTPFLALVLAVCGQTADPSASPFPDGVPEDAASVPNLAPPAPAPTPAPVLPVEPPPGAARSWGEYGLAAPPVEDHPPVPPSLPPPDPRAVVAWTAGTAAGTVVAFDAASRVLGFLGFVPVLGLALNVTGIVWPVVASTAGWYVGVRKASKRVPVVPTVLAGAGAEVVAKVLLLPCAVCPVTWPVYCLGPAAANGAATALVVSKMGRPRVLDEPDLSWDLFTVPAPPGSAPPPVKVPPRPRKAPQVLVDPEEEVSPGGGGPGAAVDADNVP